MADEIGILNAMDDPSHKAAVEQLVTLMRMGVAPLLDRNRDHIPMLQSMQITAAALFAGMTLGHMIALGVAKEQDKRRAREVLLKNFRNGIDLGKQEARKAMLEQLPEEGRA
jgi:hypothetical protein